ncbi:MAG: hypothetical protein ACUVV5_08210 [Candidatus Aminicenantales bacterium]
MPEKLAVAFGEEWFRYPEEQPKGKIGSVQKIPLKMDTLQMERQDLFFA